jgi:hypothetical protein
MCFITACGLCIACFRTLYFGAVKLVVEGRLRQERGKLVVVGSEWIEPSGLPVQQRFDF